MKSLFVVTVWSLWYRALWEWATSDIIGRVNDRIEDSSTKQNQIGTESDVNMEFGRKGTNPFEGSDEHLPHHD